MGMGIDATLNRYEANTSPDDTAAYANNVANQGLYQSGQGSSSSSSASQPVPDTSQALQSTAALNETSTAQQLFNIDVSARTDMMVSQWNNNLDIQNKQVMASEGRTTDIIRGEITRQNQASAGEQTRLNIAAQTEGNVKLATAQGEQTRLNAAAQAEADSKVAAAKGAQDRQTAAVQGEQERLSIGSRGEQDRLTQGQFLAGQVQQIQETGSQTRQTAVTTGEQTRLTAETQGLQQRKGLLQQQMQDNYVAQRNYDWSQQAYRVAGQALSRSSASSAPGLVS